MPDVIPSLHMGPEQLIEVTRPRHPGPGSIPASERAEAGSDEGDHLLDPHRFPVADRHGQYLPGISGFPTTRRATETDVSSRKTRVRAASAIRTCDWMVSTVTCTESSSWLRRRLERDDGGEAPVAGNAAILDPAIDCGEHLQFA